MTEVRIQQQNVRADREVAAAGNDAKAMQPTVESRAIRGTGDAALHAPADAARTSSAAQALLGHAAHETASAPPNTPMSRIAAAPLEADASVRSFVDNLHALDFTATNDADSMTSAFLKLEVTNMSTNQDMEQLLNQAKHFIREAALAVAKAKVDQGLLTAAGQMEHRAADMIRKALHDSGRTDKRLSQALDDMDHAGSGTPMSKQAASETWHRVYDAAGRAVRESAKALKEEKDAQARGDTHAARAAHERAQAADSRARTMLEAAHIKVSDPDMLRSMAEDMEAAGDHGNVVTKYLDEHPEAASGALSEEALAQAHGGQGIADALMEDASTRAAAGDAAGTAQLGHAANAASQQALSEFQSGLPADSPLRNTLGRAGALLRQADATRAKAIATQTGIDAAEKVVAEGRTDEGQFGVQRRNAATQDEIMRGLSRLLGGTRPDQQSRDQANREARESHAEVVRLLRDFISHDTASSSRRGQPERV